MCDAVRAPAFFVDLEDSQTDDRAYQSMHVRALEWLTEQHATS